MTGINSKINMLDLKNAQKTSNIYLNCKPLDQLVNKRAKNLFGSLFKIKVNYRLV